jgi:Trk K+ transport system NAD-binding subunit
MPERSTARGPSIRRRYPLGRLIRANLYDLWLLLNESWLVLAGFCVLTLIGTLYLRFAYDPCRYGAAAQPGGCRLSFVEALFETVKLQTLQSSLPFPSDSLLGEAIFFIVPLLGLALIFQGVLNFGRLLLDKGGRREAWQMALASTYRDHVIVCGLGQVGLRTADQLIDAGFEPVVVEQHWSSEFVEATVNNKVPVVSGDAREPLTLERAGLRHACALVAAVNDDLLNLEIALTARSTRPGLRVILRVFNDELDRNLERSFGIHTAFSASALAAPTYAAAAVSRDVDVVLHDTRDQLAITRMLVEPHSAITGFSDGFEQQNGVRVLLHKRSGQPLSAPGIMSQVTAGDQLTLLGSVARIEQVRAANQAGAPSPRHLNEQYATVIVCGLGKVGYRVVRRLASMRPRPRIVVVRLSGAPNDFPQRIEQIDGIQTVLGDAREPAVLREAGIETAFSLAALTSDDLLNLQIGLAARQARPDLHVVLRAFSDTLANQLAELFGIGTAYSTSALASPTLAAAALIGDVSQGFLVGDRLQTITRLAVESGDPLVGQSVEQLRSAASLLVIELQRGREFVSLPAPDVRFQAGDLLGAIGPIEQVARMRAGRARLDGDGRLQAETA